MQQKDEALEVQIHLAWLVLNAAATQELQRAAFNRMRDLIAQRSEAQIKKFEIERGLR